MPLTMAAFRRLRRVLWCLFAAWRANALTERGHRILAKARWWDKQARGGGE